MDPVTGSAFNRPEPGSGRVLGGDRPGMSSGVARWWSPAVSPAVGSNGSGRPADAADRVGPIVGPVPVVLPPKGDRHRAYAAARGARDHPPDRSFTIDGLAKAPPQRADSQSLGDVSGDDCANGTHERRAGRPKRQADPERRLRNAPEAPDCLLSEALRLVRSVEALVGLALDAPAVDLVDWLSNEVSTRRTSSRCGSKEVRTRDQVRNQECPPLSSHPTRPGGRS